MLAPLRRGLLALALACLLPAVANAAKDWPVPRGPSREPNPYRYDPAAWKAVPKAFLDDAPACVLYSATSHNVAADGTTETTTHEVTRLNSRKAVEQLGEHRAIVYYPEYEKLTLNEARVHKADGSVVAIEPKHVQLRDVGTDYQVYDAGKQLIISMPNLQAGDVIEVKWTVRGRNPEYAGHFFTRYQFGDDRYPLVADELRVRLPKDRPFKYAAVNAHLAPGGKLEPTVRDDGDFRLYTWRVTDRRELPRDGHLPPLEELRLQVACSTFPSWEAVGEWKRTVRASCWLCSADVRQTVREVTKGLDDPIARARALTYWLRRNIRYVSVGDKHDFTPHPPALVFENRFGDCKDTSQLLAVMLREAGVPAELVSIGVRGDGQVLEEVPSPWSTHAILLVRANGEEHWIDTTASLAAWDFLPQGDRDRLAYVLEEKGIRLLRTPKLTAGENRTAQHTAVAVGPEGTTHNVRRATYSGLAALSRRDDWSDVPSGERRRLVSGELLDANNRSRLRRLEIDEAALKDLDRPVTARIVFDVIEQLQGSPDLEGSVTDSTLWSALLSVSVDFDRTLPVELDAPFESVHRYSVEAPLGFRLLYPPSAKTVKSKWGTFRLKADADEDGRALAFELNTRIERTRVEPEDFEAFRQFQEDVTKAYRVYLTLRPAADPASASADARMLEAMRQLVPGDRRTALLLTRLYLNLGRDADAERIVKRARAFHPDDRTLLELQAKAASALGHAEGPYRELVKRFPNEPKYALELGRVLIESGKPAAARPVLEPLTERLPARTAADAHYQIARCLLAEGKPKEALSHFRLAATADSAAVESVAALVCKGKILEALEREGDAANAYRDALLVEPNAREPLERLVRLALKADDRPEALKYLRRFVVAAGDDPNALAKAADGFLKLGRLDSALELAAKANADRPSKAAERVLGLVHARRGDWAEAVARLRHADRDSPEVREALRTGYVALGRLEDAEPLAKDSPVVRDLLRRSEVVRKAAPGVSREAADAFVCAEHLYETGAAPAKVEGLLREALKEAPDFGPALALRGLLSLERGRLAKALDDAERAVKAGPREARGYYVRGRVRFERGQNGALADLEKAAELSGRKDGRMLHWLAAALLREGKRDDARKAQQEAARLLPDDPEVNEPLQSLGDSGAR